MDFVMALWLLQLQLWSYCNSNGIGSGTGGGTVLQFREPRCGRAFVTRAGFGLAAGL